MKKTDIIRAWKDAEFRAELGDRAPAHPAGDLDDDDLRRVSGGGDVAGAAAEARTASLFSYGCPCAPRITRRRMCG